MSKSKEELNALKEEVEAVNEKCRELTEEELEQVNGGGTPIGIHVILTSVIDSPVREMKAFKYGE